MGMSIFSVIFAEDRLHLSNLEQALLHSVCTIFAKDRLHLSMSCTPFGQAVIDLIT